MDLQKRKKGTPKCLLLITHLDTSSLTNQAIEELILQLKQELTERENAEIKTARDKAIEALKKFIQLGGYVSIEAYDSYNDDGYLEVECTFPQNISPDSDNFKCIKINAD